MDKKRPSGKSIKKIPKSDIDSGKVDDSHQMVQTKRVSDDDKNSHEEGKVYLTALSSMRGVFDTSDDTASSNASNTNASPSKTISVQTQTALQKRAAPNQQIRTQPSRKRTKLAK